LKYLIKARIEVEGIVDKPDIIGAIFGQTEGIFGEEYDLRELQEKGRIGRIQVDIKTQGSKTKGEVTIPSNLDRVETALIAAMIEVVDRVGPYSAKLSVIDIVDLREEKVKKIVNRAKEILSKMIREKHPDIKEIIDNIVKSVRTAEVIKYGPENLPAGPDVDKSDTIIIVEGRADVINLLKYGYRNVIALEGAGSKIPETIIKLAKKKTAIAFLDGDHGGDLILKELLRVADIDYIARAPPGREVEELTGKEIAKCLKNMVPVEQYVSEKKVEEKVEKLEEVKKELQIPHAIVEKVKSLQGTLQAALYDEKWNEIDTIPVKDLVDYIATTDKNIYAIVFDGIISQRLIDTAMNKGVKVVIGARIGGVTKKPVEITLLSFNDVL